MVAPLFGLPKMVGRDKVEVEAGGVTLLLHLCADVDDLLLVLGQLVVVDTPAQVLDTGVRVQQVQHQFCTQNNDYSGYRYYILYAVLWSGSGSAWIRNFCLDPELKFRIRIQQKVKEHINKTVNSGLFVLLDSSIE